MNLRKLVNEINSAWNEKITFKVEYDDENDCVSLRGTIRPKAYDDHVLLSMDIYDKGDHVSLYIDFVFDKLEITREALRLINNFNNESLFLKAQVDTEGTPYLRLVFNNKFIAGEYVLQVIRFAISELVDDDVVEALTPLTELTED